MRTLYATSAVVLALDQLTKALITARLALNEAIEVVPGLLSIVHVRNRGAAFGILSDGGAASKLLLIAVSVAALAIIAALVRQSADRLTAFSLSLVAGGAIGNLVDRARFGYVVDFLDVYAGRYHWPAFNVADSAITVGVVLALLSLHSKEKKGS